MIIAHLLKLCDVTSLILTNLFKFRNRVCLLDAHFLLALVVLISPTQLFFEHLHVALYFLSDATLPVNFDVKCAKVVQLDELLLHVSLVCQALWKHWLARFGQTRMSTWTIDRDGSQGREFLADARLFLTSRVGGTCRSFESFLGRSVHIGSGNGQNIS